MSTDVVILKCLGKACQEEIQMFERLVIIFNDTTRMQSYACVGKHCLFFVDQEMDGLIPEVERLPYMQISRAVVDASTQRLFLLEIDLDYYSDDGGFHWAGGDRILVDAQQRDFFVERIGMCWQTEFMYRHFKVKKFPLARASIGRQFDQHRQPGHTGQELQVLPFRGYEDAFAHRGYGVFLRSGFRNTSGLQHGIFTHDAGWEVKHYGNSVVVPAGVEVTLHVGDLVALADLERSMVGHDDLRTTAHTYRQTLVENLDLFYVTVNGSYLKRMNRTGDIASWDGWEFFIRAKEYVFACVLLRREYIPPMCDTAQDVIVLLRCPAQVLNHDTCEVLIDECRFIADSVAPSAHIRHLCAECIQARLDSLQCTEEAYRWFQGRLRLTPVHRSPAAIKFLKSIIKALESEGQLADDTLLDEDLFKGVPALHDPLLVAQEMLSDAEALLGDGTKKEREECRAAWYQRISKYLAYCVDGGLLGDRFNLGVLIQGLTDMGANRVLRNVVEFLLHVKPRGAESQMWSTSTASLTRMLRDFECFGQHTFNRSVMRGLLQESYISAEWKKANRGTNASYECLLANFLTNPDLGLPLKTLVCRQVLENTSTRDLTGEENEQQLKVLVHALMQCMEGTNVSLSSCATAALVNLSCDNDDVKNMLVVNRVVSICTTQLKSKDDDLTSYTLFLLVNLTKRPHHRTIVVREGAVPLIVDILTSSYQNSRKQKILADVASVIGQLCNDDEYRSSLSSDYPVVPCLLWVNDQVQPNCKLKAKLLFALRQLAAEGQNKINIGRQAVMSTVEQIAHAVPGHLDCAMNAMLLLLALSSVRANVVTMAHENRLEEALDSCGLQKSGQEKPGHRFGPILWEKAVMLKARIREESIIK